MDETAGLAGLGGLGAEALWRWPDAELAAALVEGEGVLRREYARAVRLVGEAERRGLASRLGYRDLVALLRTEARLSGREARERVAQAVAVEPGRALGGDPRPAPLAATGEALARGEVGPEHVQEIGRVFARYPDVVPAAQRASDEATLLGVAVQAPPETVRQVGRRLLGYWQHEHADPEREAAELAWPRRELRYRYLPSGRMRFTGELDAETAATLEGLFGPLACPRGSDEDGRPDVRGSAERHGDALAEIIDCAARADELTVQGGEHAVLTATIEVTELQRRTRAAVLDLPGHTSLEQLRRLACHAKIVPAIYNATGEILHLGRAARSATPAQRRALGLRDRGCASPGCTRPTKWCVPHHITWWSHGGGTDLDNLVLVCTHHHWILHHTEWHARHNPTDRLPEFLPPARLDPQRKPLRNTTHPPPHQRRPSDGATGHAYGESETPRHFPRPPGFTRRPATGTRCSARG